jgi:hypothetical protein
MKAVCDAEGQWPVPGMELEALYRPEDRLAAEG